MKRFVVIVLISFLFVACSSVATETLTPTLDLDGPIQTAISQTKTAASQAIDSPEETSPLEETKPVDATEPVSVSPTNIPDSGANLELYVRYITREPIGNGLDRLRITLFGKNASTGWHSYDLANDAAGYSYENRCWWELDDDGSGARIPKLITKEGFEYEAITARRNLQCGIRWTPIIPPGFNFWIMANRVFAVLHFDIAESVTPDSIIVSYQCDRGKSTECEDLRITTIDLDEFNGEEVVDFSQPFDENFHVKINQRGELYKAGENVSIRLNSPIIDGAIIKIPIEINNTNIAYPIIISRYQPQNFMLVFTTGGFFSGELIEDSSSEYEIKIGPMQTLNTYIFIDKDDQALPNDNFWLIGQLEIAIDNPSETKETIRWITDIGELTDAISGLDRISTLAAATVESNIATATAQTNP